MRTLTRRSAKQAPRTRRRKTPDATDQALQCCANLQSLARLLEITGAETGASWVEAVLVTYISGLVAEEVEYLRELLESS